MNGPKIAIACGHISGEDFTLLNPTESELLKNLSDRGYKRVSSTTFASTKSQDSDQIEFVFSKEDRPQLVSATCVSTNACSVASDPSSSLTDDAITASLGISVQSVYTSQFEPVDGSTTSFEEVVTFHGQVLSLRGVDRYYDRDGVEAERPAGSTLNTIFRKDKYREVDTLIYSVGREGRLNMWNTCLGVLYELNTNTAEFTPLRQVNIPRLFFFQVATEHQTLDQYSYVWSLTTGGIADEPMRVYQGTGLPDDFTRVATGFADTGIAHHPSYKLMTGVQYRESNPVTMVTNADIVLIDELGSPAFTIYDQTADHWIRRLKFQKQSIEQLAVRRLGNFGLVNKTE